MTEQQTTKQRVGGWLWWSLKYAAVSIISGIAVVVGLHPGQKIQEVTQTAKPLIVGGGEPGDLQLGWVADPPAVEAVAKTLPVRAFKSTPAALVAEVPAHVYLWELAKKATGAHIPARDQGGVGSCVAFGSVCAVEYLECVQMVTALRAGQPPPPFRALSQEVVYGGSRVQIGGGVLRGEDGSTGAWAAQWVNKYGVVARGSYGPIDLGQYSESRCRQYGDNGCPSALVPVAKQFPVKAITLVGSVEEARQALANGYPITVASNVGFGNRGPWQRDADGFLRASGTWAHQMSFVGYKIDNRPGFYCMNSWGSNWVQGPTGPGDPPPGGFWVDDKTVAKMLAQGDSWAYGDLAGFIPRPLDWLILAPRQPHHRNQLNLEVTLAW